MDKDKFRVIICGSRSFDNYPLLEEVVDNILHICNLSYADLEIVSGAAQGADTLGEKYAHSHNIPCVRFLAEWNNYGKSAGPIRNSRMIEYVGKSDRGAIVIAFVGKDSVGTLDTIHKAQRANIEVFQIHYDFDKPFNPVTVGDL